MVREDRGALVLNWDALEAMFRPDVLDEMFHAYGLLLEHLVEEDASWDRTLAENAIRLQAQTMTKINPGRDHRSQSLSVERVDEPSNQMAGCMPARLLPSAGSQKTDPKIPAPAVARRVSEETTTSAATPIEEKLLTMMRQVLRNNAVRPNDNFFLAGGHSLLAMQLLMRVRDIFGVEMTLRRLFEAPTVA